MPPLQLNIGLNQIGINVWKCTFEGCKGGVDPTETAVLEALGYDTTTPGPEVRITSGPLPKDWSQGQISQPMKVAETIQNHPVSFVHCPAHKPLTR